MQEDEVEHDAIGALEFKLHPNGSLQEIPGIGFVIGEAVLAHAMASGDRWSTTRQFLQMPGSGSGHGFSEHGMAGAPCGGATQFSQQARP